MKIELQEQYPMSSTHLQWFQNKYDCASGWITSYMTRLNMYHQHVRSICNVENIIIDD